jgi:hypothetical protein
MSKGDEDFKKVEVMEQPSIIQQRQYPLSQLSIYR